MPKAGFKQLNKQYNTFFVLICKDCLVTFESKNKRRCKDGAHRCKKCIKKLNDKKYRLRHLNKFKTYRRTHYYANREQSIQEATDWNRANKQRRNEIVKKSCRKRREADPLFFKLKKAAKKHGVSLVELNDLEQRCQLCGATDNLSVDHMHPTSKGGTSDVSNLQTLCISCNSFKGSRLLLPGGGVIV